MRRRSFIAGVGATAALLPASAGAQQQLRRPLIGFLNPAFLDHYRAEVEAFEQGLAESGYASGKSLTIEYRWAQGDLARLPTLATELVRLQPDAIVSTAGIASTRAAAAATKTIPIVFAVGTDPVRLGIVSSLNRPGGNATGVSIMTTELEAKRIDLLAQLAPRATPLAVLVNGASPEVENKIEEALGAARKLGSSVEIFRVASVSDFAPAFERLATKARLLAVLSDPLFVSGRKPLVELAARHGIPAVYQHRGIVESGGLMSYGTNLRAIYRFLGGHVARVLKGEKPADLPVQQPTRFELVLNLKTAKALGLEMPATLLAIADEVIE